MVLNMDMLKYDYIFDMLDHGSIDDLEEIARTTEGFPCGMDDFIVVSLGRDGIMEDWEFDENAPESGLFVLTGMDDFNKDIVMWNGSWIRATRDDF